MKNSVNQIIKSQWKVSPIILKQIEERTSRMQEEGDEKLQTPLRKERISEHNAVSKNSGTDSVEQT